MKKFLGRIYEKLFRINDTPQKIAQGFGLGVFLGIMPGLGPVAALFLAMAFKVNRAAALIGSLLTNGWFSLVTFVLSIKIGSAIMKIEWRQEYENFLFAVKNFHWQSLFDASVFKILLPAFIGYLVIAACAGAVVYFVAWIIAQRIGREKSKS